MYDPAYKQQLKQQVDNIMSNSSFLTPPKPKSKLRMAGEGALGLATLAGTAYASKKILDKRKKMGLDKTASYDNITMKYRMEKAAMINSLVDEIIKIAEEEKKGPPKWAGEAADIAGFIGGAAVGSYTGDIAASRLLKIKSPAARSFARYVGAGLAGYATMKALPHLRKNAPEAVRDLIGGEDEGK